MKSLIKIARLFVIVLAFGFLTHYLTNNYSDFKKAILQINSTRFFLAALFAIGSLFCKALLNAILLKGLLHTKTDNSILFLSFVHAGIVKYIPGKIWSVMYQASALSKNIKKGDVWIVTIYQILITNLVTILIALACIVSLGSIDHQTKIFIFLALLITGYTFFLNKGRIFKLLKVNGETFRKYSVLINKPMMINILLVLTLDWLLYLGMWIFLCGQELSFGQTFYTAVSYAAASFVGIIIFIFPNGLIIREATFVTIGNYLGTSMSYLIILSIAARLIYVLADIILFVSFAAYDRLKRNA